MDFIDTLIAFFIKTSPLFTGVTDDLRPESEHALDYLHEERFIAYGTDPKIFHNPKPVKNDIYEYNQWYVGACVAHGVGLALDYELTFKNKLVYEVAPLFAYRLRPNYPQAGSWLQAAFDTYKKYGAPYVYSMPITIGMTEAQANKATINQRKYEEAAIQKGAHYYQLSLPNNIVTLATLAQTPHAVPIVIYATEREWAHAYPVLLDNPTWDTAPIRHCVCILPNSSFMENGERYVAVYDSAWFGGINIRYLSEGFIAARVVAAGYWDKVAELGGGTYPKYTFTNRIKFGQRSDDVKAMQRLFIADGLLASDCASGYFGGQTLAGLHAFQLKHAADILVPLKLTQPTDIFGDACAAVANRLCQ